MLERSFAGLIRFVMRITGFSISDTADACSTIMAMHRSSEVRFWGFYRTDEEERKLKQIFPEGLFFNVLNISFFSMLGLALLILRVRVARPDELIVLSNKAIGTDIGVFKTIASLSTGNKYRVYIHETGELIPVETRKGFARVLRATVLSVRFFAGGIGGFLLLITLAIFLPVLFFAGLYMRRFSRMNNER